MKFPTLTNKHSKMKKVININFQGRVVPIEESAYEILKRYIESLTQFFANEEGRDEIINDIESRVGELFAEQLKKGSSCITDDDVHTIINSMGRPEDFEAEESNLQGQLGSKTQANESGSSNQTYTNASFARTDRLFRDENHKLIGGVCAGLANHFGVDLLVVRVLFVLFTLAFGFGIIVYLILWVAIPSTASTTIGSVRKRLFRDPENKLIGGVCGGLASYFGVNVWVPRLLFLIPFLSFVTSWNHWGVFNFPNFLNLSFSPGATLVYIILWLIIPEALSTSDRLEMKGEKVNLNSIKNTIQKDMEGFGERAKEFGKEVGEKASKIGTDIGKKGKQFGSEATTVVRKTGTSLGDVIALIFKIIGYFIAAVVLVSIVGVLFGAGVFVTGLLPYKPYFINDGWQNILAWGTYIFFIWIPVIGIITWIIRKIARIKSNSSAMRFSFIAMWILGWFCLIGLFASISSDFSYHNSPQENKVTLTNPQVNKLQVKYINNNRYYFNNSFFDFHPFASVEDTIFPNNIHLRILKSDSDSFSVTLLKLAYGPSKKIAEQRAQNISFDINQTDSILSLDRGIPITKDDKFRNQSVYITIYMPIGKRILVDDGIGWGNDMHFGFNDDVNEWDWRTNNNEGHDWGNNIEYVMTDDGLKPTHPSENNDDNNDDDNGNSDDQQQPVTPNTNDSSRYHYQPLNDTPKAAVKKAEVKIHSTSFNNASIKITDMTSAFLERFSL
jgi:phage shock protein PspC (stress-responsive transcriptional regulator)